MAELENGYSPLSTAEERRRSILSSTAGRNTGCTNISSPATTPIAISACEAKPIRDIRVGDTVLAFDTAAGLGRGALVPRRVVRTHRNATREWVRPAWLEAVRNEPEAMEILDRNLKVSKKRFEQGLAQDPGEDGWEAARIMFREVMTRLFCRKAAGGIAGTKLRNIALFILHREIEDMWEGSECSK